MFPSLGEAFFWEGVVIAQKRCSPDLLSPELESLDNWQLPSDKGLIFKIMAALESLYTSLIS